MKKAFATNLRKARSRRKLTQQEVADHLSTKLSTYQAYEEGRAFPAADRLVAIADLFGVANLRSFISEYEWDPENEYPPIMRIRSESPIQSNYLRLSARDRAVVDILLGVRNIE